MRGQPGSVPRTLSAHGHDLRLRRDARKASTSRSRAGGSSSAMKSLHGGRVIAAPAAR
jgi:hypothetical protein